MGLASQTCTACSGGVDPIKGDEIDEKMEQLDGDWEVINEHHLKRDFEFEDFQEALDFVNKVGGIAEEEGHHPNIEFTWGKATIKLYTHKIDGLYDNDFIMAAKIDQMHREEFTE
ncbi:MAG: 4a-hydroxytetrahydrobiopterin dehydratase [Candidatus Nanohaloarchaea archaeon]